MTIGDMKRIDGRPIPDNRQEIRAFLTVRNDMLRLASTLRHYRQLGVGRFFVLDTGSTDGTLELLATAPDIHAFSVPAGPAGGGDGVARINALLDAYGVGSWTLTVGAGELFIYPHYEQLELPLFCRYLDYLGAQAVGCLLLDMYSAGPIRDTVYQSGTPLLKTCPYFDAAPYRMERTESPPYFEIHGGMRERVFCQGKTTGDQAPGLSRVPLVKWRVGMEFSQGTRSLSAAVIANVLTVLLRFEFLGDFHERVRTESALGELFDDMGMHRAYRDLLRDNESVSLFSDKSVQFENSAQLVQLGLMTTTKAYEESVRLTAAARAAQPA
jgi:hypothetical protein